jgi:hypothetical protein
MWQDLKILFLQHVVSFVHGLDYLHVHIDSLDLFNSVVGDFLQNAKSFFMLFLSSSFHLQCFCHLLILNPRVMISAALGFAS